MSCRQNSSCSLRIFSPPQRTIPFVGSSSPHAMRRRLVFPAPLAPPIRSSSPPRSLKPRPLNNVRSPRVHWRSTASSEGIPEVFFTFRYGLFRQAGAAQILKKCPLALFVGREVKRTSSSKAILRIEPENLGDLSTRCIHLSQGAVQSGHVQVRRHHVRLPADDLLERGKRLLRLALAEQSVSQHPEIVGRIERIEA